MNLSINIVGYLLSMNKEKYICQSVVADLIFVTDKVELLMKTFTAALSVCSCRAQVLDR